MISSGQRLWTVQELEVSSTHTKRSVTRRTACRLCRHSISCELPVVNSPQITKLTKNELDRKKLQSPTICTHFQKNEITRKVTCEKNRVEESGLSLLKSQVPAMNAVLAAWLVAQESGPVVQLTTRQISHIKTRDQAGLVSSPCCRHHPSPLPPNPCPQEQIQVRRPAGLQEPGGGRSASSRSRGSTYVMCVLAPGLVDCVGCHLSDVKGLI